MTSSHPTPISCHWFSWLAAALDRRSAPRLALLFPGAVLARGRRTVTTWIRAGKLSDRFPSCYIAVAAGKKADRDPETGAVARLFDPRRQKWNRHVRWAASSSSTTSALGPGSSGTSTGSGPSPASPPGPAGGRVDPIADVWLSSELNG